MPRALLWLAALLSSAPGVAGHPAPECGEPIEHIACELQEIMDYVCAGVFHLAADTVVVDLALQPHLGLSTVQGTWLGVVIADGGDWPASSEGYSSFVFLGAILDGGICPQGQLMHMEPGAIASLIWFWALGPATDPRVGEVTCTVGICP